MRQKLFGFFLLCFGSLLNAQDTTSSYIIQWNSNQEMIQTYIRNFESIHPIYEEMNLWELRVNNVHLNALNVQSSYDYWSKLPQVKWINPSRFVDKRVLPNDPYYGNQPYLSNINLEYVWNYQKNGIDINGDTLVIAYIDDGVDLDHPDLKDNLYVNHLEIPSNNLDDDANGYIDDYRGWNSGNQDPRVFTGTSVIDGHGTQVAGVMGAKGNNNVGVTGVNWSIKILPINTYADDLSNIEAAVIRGMVYVFKQKKLYLESNKTKGANVVALNMSLGMDNAFPEDSPFWCDLYDSLGSVGVWCYSATTNRNIDVGVSGDIPTLCPSEFLISVNVVNQNDQHYSSGYSDTFIELAAPGVNIHSTTPRELNQQNPYVTETGTSYASPMVAGISALVESMSCAAYLKLKREDPLAAITLWRSWLSESVLKNSSLTSKNRWGGRVDAEALFEQMSNWCVQNDTNYNQVQEEYFLKNIHIFPNPSENEIFFKAEAEGKLRCFDGLGRLLWEGNVQQGTQNLKFQDYSGLVFFEFTDEKGRRLKKSHIFLNR